MSRRNNSRSTSSFATLLVANTLAHMASLPIPRDMDIPPIASIPVTAATTTTTGNSIPVTAATTTTTSNWQTNTIHVQPAIPTPDCFAVPAAAVAGAITDSTISVNALRKGLGRASMQRDRLMQQAKTFPEMWQRNKDLLKRQQQRIARMRKDVQRAGPPPTMQDVYDLLDSKTFQDCPWPIPPSAILMFLPIAEIPGVRSAEASLRKIHGDDKSLKYISNWEFINGPRPHFT